MDLSLVYSKTAKGLRTVKAWSSGLPSRLEKVLSLIDGKSNLQEILSQSDVVSEDELEAALTELEVDGYIRPLVTRNPEIHETQSHHPASITVEEVELDTLDFTNFKADVEADAGRKAKEEAEARVSLEMERKAKEEAAKAEVERKVREAAEAKAKAEAARKAQEEAEAKAKAKLEQERKAKEEAERKAKQEAEARAEAERKAREAAEAKAKAEAERKAQKEAEAKTREESERKAREEAEAKARAEAERTAQEEAAKAKLELERKEREAAEAKARAEAEKKAQEEAEDKARMELERKAKEEAEAKAREESERKAREELESEARKEAERQAKKEAEAEAELERKVREEAEEARVRADSERKKQQEAEARAREEAESREREAALARAAERDLEAFPDAVLAGDQDEDQPGAVRKSRVNFLRLGSIVAASVLACAFLLVVAIHFVNLAGFIPVEKLASEKIGGPVSVRSMHASLLPSPRFVLEGVTVPGAPDVKIGTIRIVPVIGTLFEENRIFRSIEINSLVMPKESLSTGLKWMEAIHGQGRVRLGHITLRNSRIDIRGLQLPAFNGEIGLGTADQFESVKLRSTDDRLSLEIAPGAAGYTFVFSASSWQPPAGTRFEFSELGARGVISRNAMKIDDITGKLYSGVIKGNAIVDWQSTISVTGDLTLANASLSGISQALAADIALTGSVDMQLTYSAKSGELAQLLDKPGIRASFTARDGTIGGVDLARLVVRDTRGSSENVTRFDTLSGTLLLTDGLYQFKQLKLAGGQLTAGGDVELAENNMLAGRISARMDVQSRQFQIKLGVSGNTKEPQFR